MSSFLFNHTQLVLVQIYLYTAKWRIISPRARNTGRVKNPNTFHIQISQELIAAISQFPRVQPKGRG